MRPSHKLPLPPRIYTSLQQLYATLPESTPLSQNTPPFQHLYATLPKSTHPSRNNIPLPLFLQLDAILRESTLQH